MSTMTLTSGALGLVAAGWLATALASTNGDVDAGIAAYQAGDHDAALAAYEAATAALGERPEIHYDRGLALLAKGDAEAARKAFEHGTESDHPKVRASSEYELGNLDFDAKSWDAAIERYTKCLKIDPDHAAAKWNLELALLRKKQEEEEKEKEKEKQDQDQQEKQDQDQQEKQDQDQQEKQDQDQQEKQDQSKPQGQEPQPQPTQPQQLDRADLDKALEQLDAEDPFTLGRPLARPMPVEKDW